MNEALCFNDVLCYGENPAPIEGRNGSFFLRLLVKNASSVQMLFADRVYDFEKGDGEIWELELPFDTAFSCVQIKINGNDVLTPLLPITYGYSRPYNYIELPASDSDFYGLRAVPHGSVRREYFFSEITKEWESCLVYTPLEYDNNPQKVYPVLYLQHGHGENETGWVYSGRANLIMDNLIAAKKAIPFVIVMNNGMVQRGGVVDHLLFEPMLLNDVIPFIEERFRVGGCKKLRGMAGLSMGSIQTAMTAFRHPELFSEVGIFSGFLRDWISGSELDMSGHAPSENTHLKALEDAGFNSCFNIFFRAMGDEDPFLEHFLKDDQICREHSVHCIRKIYRGTHDWNVWRRCLFDFAQMIFRQEETWLQED